MCVYGVCVCSCVVCVVCGCRCVVCGVCAVCMYVCGVCLYDVCVHMVCMCVCYIYAVTTEARRKCQILWSWSYKWLCYAQHRCQELNSGPLDKQQTLLATELSLQNFFSSYLKGVRLRIISFIF